MKEKSSLKLLIGDNVFVTECCQRVMTSHCEALEMLTASQQICFQSQGHRLFDMIPLKWLYFVVL